VTRDVFVRTDVLMGTLVTIQVVGRGVGQPPAANREHAVTRAFEWFRNVEACCSRFDPKSELSQLSARIGVPVPASAMLYEAVAFALAVAKESGGAFDPTVGHRMAQRGFNREHRTGRTVSAPRDAGRAVSYHDIRLDPDRRTITLLRPLMLDLGAVAKGLAIDMAARELQPLEHFAIDAGGDLYLGGHNQDDEAWSVGIRHPREDHHLIDALRVSNQAVCTSGDYERHAPGDDLSHHILDPRTGAPASEAASVTVVAATAMLADALATAAFVLGPAAGMRLLDRLGVEGLIISRALEHVATRGFRGARSAP
jgi:thiamine biosynthesis lipoprotein